MGTLAYVRQPAERQLVWLDRSGQRVGSLGGADADQPLLIRLSPDGRTVALQRTVSGNSDVWLIDTARGVPRHFTSGSANDGPVIWSNDGNRIVFGSDPKGVVDLYEKPANGAGSETLLFSSKENNLPNDWSPDGRFIMYSVQTARSGYDLWALPLFGDRKPFP